MQNKITIQELKEGYVKEFGSEPKFFYSAPGRTELSGNHTDHQHGKVLAAAINLDNRAAVNYNNSNRIIIKSANYPVMNISLDDLNMKDDEVGTSASLIRGIVYRFMQLGYEVKGFNAFVMSNVLSGSGLSSSAAFEVLISTIVNDLSKANLNAIEIAKISQFAENEYFKKPCGLMDQMASSVGNCVFIDFKDDKNPIVEKIMFDFSKCGYTLCVIDSGADHANLTHEYAAITEELKNVCSVFGKKWLSEIDENDFISKVKEIKKKYGDRAVLRAIHVYEENKRVVQQVEALKNNNFSKYLDLMKESGRSSWMYLQNVIPYGSSNKQDLAYALGICDKLLKSKGVCRVHGGGFAGTIQAFVINDYVDEFKKSIDDILGQDACRIMNISSYGGRRLEE